MVVFSTNCFNTGRCRTLLRAAFVFLVLPPSPSMALTCTEVEFVAKYSMMLYRQGGQPLSAAIERFYVGEKEDADLYKKIVIDAYDQPLFTSEEYKNKESIEFSNKWYSACIKSGLEN
ncbi:TPA: hypothetical protein ACMDNH_001857 [Vibrio cholerae]|nr:hypothetical protein [Vibrio cholerae]